MPVAETIKSSWADEVEQENAALPLPCEVLENNFRILTQFKYNEDGKEIKVIQTYRIEKRIVSKDLGTNHKATATTITTIAMRKAWPKFGNSAYDKPGPNPATTTISDDVYMHFVTNKEEEAKLDEDGLEKIRALGDKGAVKCRICNGDHWTTKCPWKDTGLIAAKVSDERKANGFENQNKSSTSKYVPPSLREGGAMKRSDLSHMPRRDDSTAIRIGNLSESTVVSDLEELVKPFGPIQKLYLAKDKNTGLCKSFAYIHFKFRGDAVKAIQALNGHGYDHLILCVDWSKSSSHQN